MPPSAIRSIREHPYQFARFLYCFIIQLVLIVLHRALLPTHPRYQSFRIEVQKAYSSSTALYFPTFTHRLPADYPEEDARPITGKGWSGYLIPGQDRSVLSKATDKAKVTVILFAHGGGYARGEARMYVPYMKRWVACAKSKGLEIVFLSVEYPLSGEAAHPAQRSAFLNAYRYLLDLGVLSDNIVFMGDSAGGGICINSALHASSENMPQPAASILISPWIDMSLSAYEGGNQAVMSDYFIMANEAVPMLTKAFLGKYAGTDGDANALYRPLDQLRGLNPQLIFVGAAEFALSDSKDWARRCREAGVPHELHVEWGQTHIWAMGSKFIEPGLRRKTDERIIAWISSHVHGTNEMVH